MRFSAIMAYQAGWNYAADNAEPPSLRELLIDRGYSYAAALAFNDGFAARRRRAA